MHNYWLLEGIEWMQRLALANVPSSLAAILMFSMLLNMFVLLAPFIMESPPGVRLIFSNQRQGKNVRIHV